MNIATLQSGSMDINAITRQRIAADVPQYSDVLEQRDLSRINRSFGELGELAQWALKGAYASGKLIEIEGDPGEWSVDCTPRWYKDATYRLRGMS